MFCGRNGWVIRPFIIIVGLAKIWGHKIYPPNLIPIPLIIFADLFICESIIARDREVLRNT